MTRATFFIAATLALAASACGGGGGGGVAGGTPPKEYAAQVCGALSDWQAELQKDANTMSSSLNASSTPEDVKGKFVTFMSDSVKATQNMRAKVKAAGPPDTDKGEQVAQDLDDALGRAETAFQDAKDKAATLPTDDPAAFGREATKLGNTLTKEGNEIGAAFTTVGRKHSSKELDEAFDKEPSCKH